MKGIPLSSRRSALERLVQLYTFWGQKNKAEEWRKKLPMKEEKK